MLLATNLKIVIAIQQFAFPLYKITLEELFENWKIVILKIVYNVMMMV